MRPRRLTPRPFTALADRIENFAQIVRVSGERLSTLRGSEDDEASGRLADALDLLQEQANALSAADEELRAQVEALTCAAERSQRHHDRYKALFDVAPVPYVVTDFAGVIRETNARATELIGQTARSLQGKPLVVLATRDSVSVVLRAIAKGKRGVAHQVRIRLRGQAGQQGKLVLLSIHPAMDVAQLLCAFSEPHLSRVEDPSRSAP